MTATVGAAMHAGPIAAPTHVVRGVHPFGPEALVDYSLELPATGDGLGHAVVVQGWVIPRDRPVASVAVKYGDETLVRVRPNHVREDVVERFAGIVDRPVAGFRTAVSLLGLPSSTHLTVEIELDDAPNDVAAWAVELLRRRVATPAAMAPAPVAITTIGRTGSTWVASLLDRHPDVVAYPPWEGEARFLSYWLEVVRTLTTPTSYLVPLMPPDMAGDAWWHGHTDAPVPYPVDDRVGAAMTADHVSAAVAFARARMSAFYERLAESTGAAPARLFVEKLLPNPWARRLARDVVPELREIILVRDFRDMLASILAMDRRRGYAGFGRRPDQTDRAYVTAVGETVDLLAAAADDAPGSLIVRYEDLAKDPRAITTEMLRYLELEARPSEVDAMVAAGDAPSAALDRHRTTPDRATSIGRWRRDLPPELQDLCGAVFCDALARFGYA